MSQSVSVFLKALGLKTQPSHLNNDPGSLLQASNVVFHRDNVIQQRRGFKLYGESFGSSSDRAQQLFSYKNRILRYYNSTIDYDTNTSDSNGAGIFTPFAGSYSPVVPGLRTKSIESNGNLYFTSGAGVQKISARTAADFTPASNFIIPAGGPKAVDVNTRLAIKNGDSTDFFLQDSVVAYRILWSYNDLNGNLVPGTPSQRSEIFNPLLNLLINDLDVILQALDQLGYQTGSIINDQNYVSSFFLPNSASALAVTNNSISLANQLDANIGTLIPSGNILAASIAGGVGTISLANNAGLYGKVATGDQIYLNGFSPAGGGTLDGVQTVTGVNAITGVAQATPITFPAESGGNYSGKYFTLNSANNSNQYYVWFQTSGSGADPVVSGRIGIQINITSGASGATIAGAVQTALNSFSSFFSTGLVSATLTITNTTIGPTVPVNAGSLTGIITIGSVTTGTASSITFSTTASGPVTLLTPNIQSGWFRSYTQPAPPVNIIATDQELVDVQTYLSSILTELQSSRNFIKVATKSGSASTQPLLISSAAVTSNTTLTINFDTSITNTNAKNQFAVNDYISLSGTWTGAGAENLTGIYQIASVATGNITITLPNSTTNGAVTLNSTSEIDRIVRFTNSSQSSFITPLGITISTTVYVDITVPSDVTTNDFFQIYRSQVNSATGTTVLSELTASDEMALVFEAFPTEDQIDAGVITIQDIVLDTFRGANLYTNPQSGQGILQANDVPPLCQDINRFKNVTFYANTQTRQRQNLSLLGVTNLISEYNNGRIPQLTISTSNGATSNTYNFINGASQVTVIDFLQAETGSNYTGKYFTLNNAQNYIQYYVWYKVSGAGSDPAPAGLTAIPVVIQSSDSANTIAAKTSNAISILIRDFSTSVTNSSVTITNLNVGLTTNSTIGTFSSSTISSSTTTSGVGESAAQEITTVTCAAASGLAGEYWTINDAYNRHQYYVWYQVSGSGSDPAPSGKTGILVSVLSGDSSTTVAVKTGASLEATGFFTTSNISNVLTVSNVNFGPTNAATAATSGFTIVETVKGALNVLLSNSSSPALAVDETARSLVRIINKNRSESINAFYLSSDGGIPGMMSFEGRTLGIGTFYLVMNGSFGAPVVVGDSFSPSLAPTNFITTISAANPTQITSNNHGLVNGNQIMIGGSNSTPSINGVYTVSVIDSNNFTIPVKVTSSGNAGAWVSLLNAQSIVFSLNEPKPNRIYYSKLQQPDAVPIENNLDIGAQDQAIIRIMPLRDSLMIFKQDGLYRLSGETAPWTVDLFDSSCIVVAPDSVSITNNVIYAWTNQGIAIITESGVDKIDRDIDDDIAQRQTGQYVNFSTATWGIGYDSDKTYSVWTTLNPTDPVATIAYVYNRLTKMWSTFNKTNTCGIVNPADDKLYLGAGDTNFVEQERKNFNRLDYADREITTNLTANNYLNNGSTMRLLSVVGIKLGDVLTQTQFLTIYEFNQLLRKLDLDTGLQKKNYFSTLALSGGADLRNALINPNPAVGLAAAINSDAGIGNPNYLTPILTKTGNIASNSAASPTVFTMPRANFSPSNVNTGTSVITITGSNYSSGQQLQFTTTGTLPTGLSLNTDYFIINPTTNTFQISATLDGVAIALTTQGTGTHTVNLCHGLVKNRNVEINGVTGSIPNVDGSYIVTVIDPFNFSIPLTVTTAGTGGTYQTLDTTFQDIRACYNHIIDSLNLDSGPTFKNYLENINTTTQEAIITAVNPLLNEITLNIQLPYVLGPITQVQSILSSVVYSPLTMGDPVGYKQVNTCHALFENQIFTSATISFSTDLLPMWNDVVFNGFGNGTFGNQKFGTNFFGGTGNSQPFRTFIPRNCQRCTFMSIKFTHQIANESYKLYGIGLSGNINLSDRAYR